MADSSIIAWTDATFNPWLGCTKVSQGCKHCYAETLVKNRMGKELWGPNSNRQVTSRRYWQKPLRWNDEAERNQQRMRVFSGSLCDVFEDHPAANATRPNLWRVIRNTPWLDWQLLTKRPERIAECLPRDWGEGYPNVWLGTSIEDNRVARRGDSLRAVPAHIRFVSYEPALGPLDQLDLAGIDWVIYGGESGPDYRPHDVQWARDIRTRCDAAGVAFFYKQSAAPRTEMGIEMDGEIVRAWPRSRTAEPEQYVLL